MSRAKRVKGNTDWDTFEDWFSDEYRMYMYMVINLQMDMRIMAAFHNLWVSRKMLYILLDMEIPKREWELERIGPMHSIYRRYRRYDERIEVGVTGTVTRLQNGDSFYLRHYLQGFPTVEYSWIDKTTITAGGEVVELSMSAFVNGVINVIS